MKKIVSAIAFAFILFVTAKATDYNITDYGAVRDKNSTLSIQKTIDACFEKGGGRVVVPSGTFITGTIILKSNIDLFLERGAELRSSENLDDFVVSSEEHGMIFCEDAINVSISGEGTVNGMGSRFYDWTKNNVYPEFDRSLIRQKDKYQPVGTFFTDGPVKRKTCPGMTIVFFNCSHISLTGITVKDTPIWAIRFGYCDDAVVEYISIYNNPMIPNNDGIHMTASRNIRIANCDIRAGDDAIIVTGFDKIEDTPGYSTKEQDAHVHGNKTIYAENIIVSNCSLTSRSAGIRIGYGQHPIRRCIFSNIVIYDSNRGIGIFAHDSASIEELIFSDIIIETRLHNGQWWGHGEPIHLSSVSRFDHHPAGTIKDIQFNNITATGEQGIILYAQKENPMVGIKFNNVKLHLRKGKETMGYGGNFDLRPTAYIDKQIFSHDIPGIYAQYVDGLDINGFSLSWGPDLPDFFTDGIQCVDVKDLLVRDFSGTSNPNDPGGKKIHLVNTDYRNKNDY